MRKQLTGLWTILSSLLLGIILFSPFNLKAQLFDQPSHVQARIFSEVKWANPGQTVWLAVEMKADPEWHFYWRNFGETGKPTEFFIKAPKSITVGPVQWPYPEVLAALDIISYGYSGTQYFLIPLTIDQKAKPGEKLTVTVSVDWLECREICMPGQEELKITLPVKKEPSQVDERYVEIFSQARFKIPKPLKDWNVSASADDGHYYLQLTPPEWFNGQLEELYFFPYEEGRIVYQEKEKVEKRGNSYVIELLRSQQDTTTADTLRGVITVKPGWRGENSEKAVEISVPVGKELARTAGSGGKVSSVWIALLFSFLGGMILNLMPCVLPVLSIKIMRFIKQAQEEHTKPWKHGLVFTLGVLIAFWTLAVALLILKAGGEQLGWGFQLQSPTFLIILSAFMFLLGLSMFGVFEIGTSLTAVGGQAAQKSGWMGSFMDGVVATVVATPCTAPFMGGALGYALTQPAWVSLLIFTFLGLGMAFPFALITSIPAMLKYVPKPGRWMESLKQFMGFLLVATVIWLLWVLSQQVGALVLLLLLVDLLFTSMAAWIYGRWGNLAMPPKTRYTAWAIALIILLASNGYTLANYHKFVIDSAQTAAVEGEINWLPYSDDALQKALQEGKPVFVDFTAKWCVSCQVNEKVAFSSEEVQKKFKELGIVAFKADWTKRDPEITRALARFGRMSVPLYVLYSGKPGARPTILPEVITPGIVLDALKTIQ